MSTEPKYLHPSVTSKIIDTSSVVLTAAGLNNMFVALEAEKGAPNEAMYISSASQFIFTLGEPNFAKWGQAGMNAMNWLRAGGGLWVIRVVPDDETFASLSLGIGFNEKETYTNDEEEYKNLELTADQIKLWNLQYGAEDENRKFVRGLSTGRTVPVEKFYAGKTDKETGEILSVESKLGTMTKDAITLFNINNGNTGDNELEALGIKKEVEVRFGMSFAGYLKADAARQHVRGIKDDGTALDYISSSIGEYAWLTFVDFIPDSAEDHTAYYASAGLIKATSAVHPSGLDTLFTTRAASEEELVASVLAYTDAVSSKKTIVQWAISSNDGVYSLDWVIYTNDNFEEKYYNAPSGSTISLAANVVNFPRLMKAVYEITQAKTYSSYVTIINETFVGGSDSSYQVFDANHDRAIGVDEITVITAATIAINTEDARKLGTLNAQYYGPCYERLYSDALADFEALGLDSNSLKLAVISSEAKWQYCYDVVYKDGTPFKTAAMTKNYARWYNISAPVYAKVKNVEDNDTPSTGIYERVKTYFVNYANTGKPVYGFYMTEDAVEIFKSSQPEKRADELSVNGEMDSNTTGLESMVTDAETIFNQTVSVNSVAKDAEYQSIRALSYLAPLFTFENSAAEPSKEGMKKINATLKSSDKFADVQVRNLSSAYAGLVVVKSTVEEGETVTYLGFADNYSGKQLADLQAIGLYDANGALANVLFSIEDVEVPEVVAKILTASQTENAQIPLSHVFTDAYPVEIWNVVPAVNSTANGSDYSLVIKVSFYSTANGATLLTLEDKSGLVTFRSSSISEYKYKQNFCVVYEDSSFVPNSDYIENTYEAIGFCVTPFTDRSMDNANREGLTPADIKRGYVVDENRITIQSVDPADMTLPTTRFVEFARFLPKGSGPWYNKLAVSLTYENAYENTYPDWSMFTLSIIEKSTSSEIVRESFDVALDPDAISGTKESLFIEDVVNRYSSYLTCVANYDNLQNFIDTKLKVTDGEGNTIKDEDGNEIVPPTDKVIKYIFNQITLDDLNTATFGEDYKNSEFAEYAYTDLMSAIGYDSQLCHLDTTLNDSTGEVAYNDPFVSEFYYQTVDTNAVFYLAGGTRGHGWGYETIDPDTDETVTTATLTQALTRAYNGTTDPLITNTQTCVFDIMMDANYDITVKDAMSDLASMTRGDCITILDMNHDCANASQAVSKRKDQMQYNTYFTSIFSQTLGINDEWTGKPVRVTPTFFLATKIPQNDAAYTEIYNFVGPRRGIISGFRDVSWLPTEPEKTELYKNQINYIEQDTQATMFATENTSQKITSPLSNIHAVRSLLKLKRQMEQTARNYRMEFSTDDIRGHLQEALNTIANNKVLAGGYDYISPVVSASAYDRQQKICRIKVDLAFTDIMERFVFEFVVNRAS